VIASRHVEISSNHKDRTLIVTVRRKICGIQISRCSTVFTVAGSELLVRPIGLLRRTIRLRIDSEYRFFESVRLWLFPDKWNLQLIDSQGRYVDVLKGYGNHELFEVAGELQALRDASIP
jgi:hypothetical protein